MNSTTGQTRRRIFTLDGAVVSRANLRGPFNNQGVIWLRTYLFNHSTISFLGIFHSLSNSQILDFSLMCFPFASDDCLYAFTPKRTFSTIIFGSIFRECLCRLYENTAISFISTVNVKIFNLVIC